MASSKQGRRRNLAPLKKREKEAVTCLRGKWRKILTFFLAVAETELLTLWLILSNCLAEVCGRVLAHFIGLCMSSIRGSVLRGVECGEALQNICVIFSSTTTIVWHWGF